MGCMAWNGKAERDVLERILALLLSLARLADRVACLPAPVRLPVLAILGYGEARARSFVTGMALDAPAWVDAFASPAAGHAERLSLRFRALALMLGAMLVRAGRDARFLAREAGFQAGLPISSSEAARPNGSGTQSVPIPDTS